MEVEGLLHECMCAHTPTRDTERDRKWEGEEGKGKEEEEGKRGRGRERKREVAHLFLLSWASEWETG